jgi:hypothetical protein
MSILAPAILIVNSNPFDPKALVGLMHETFPREFDKVMKVREEYTLKQHVGMVLGQYEKYFAGKPLPGGFTDGQFRLFLAVHDLGKPQAEWEGNKKLQLVYNPQRFEEHFPGDSFIMPAQRALLKSFLFEDPIGYYLRNGGDDIAGCLAKLESMYGMASWVSRRDYLRLLLVYYMSDAGSYTLDAGGIPSLDHHFDFRTSSMGFSSKSKPYVDALVRRFMEK